MVCLGILWNGISEYSEEVIQDISKYCELIESFSIDLGDYYEDFVREIYAQDHIADWKVDKKLETMFKCSDSRVVNIIFVNIDTKDTHYHEFKKRMVYTNLENMKTNIRAKYSKYVNPYFFDNVMHMTDDESEYKNDYNVVIDYAKKMQMLKLIKILKKGNNIC